MLVGEDGVGFDPFRMRRLLEKSGFSIPRLELTVRGSIEETPKGLVMKTPGLEKALRLPDTKNLKPGETALLVGLLRTDEDGMETLSEAAIASPTADPSPQ